MTKLSRFFSRETTPVSPFAPPPYADYPKALKAQMREEAPEPDCGLHRAADATRLAWSLYEARLEAFPSIRPTTGDPLAWTQLPLSTRQVYVDLAATLLPILGPRAEAPQWDELADQRGAYAATWFALRCLAARLDGDEGPS